MRYSFEDFSYDFDDTFNVYRDVFEISMARLIAQGITPPGQIRIYGCFPKASFFSRSILRLRAQYSPRMMVTWLQSNLGYRVTHRKSGDSIDVWITFENRRPPASHFDLTLSFDIDSLDGKNVYFPLIFRYIDFFDRTPANNNTLNSWANLTSKRQHLIESGFFDSRKKFACAFINNPETVRLEFIKRLEEIGPVDIFGRYSGNYVRNKIEVAKDYQFQVCFENDLYPGYITEKPLEAWLSGNVPIYSGLDTKSILNSDALLNLQHYESQSELLDRISNLYNSPEERIRVTSSPLMSDNYGPCQIQSAIESRLKTLLK